MIEKIETNVRIPVPRTALSLGAGVQSTALLLMCIHGDFDMPEQIIFSDTGWEPKATYEHLGKLDSFCRKYGIKITTVKKGNLRIDALRTDGERFASMPLFTKDDKGKVSMLRRQCTREYKLEPIMRELRSLGASKENPYEVWLGISIDEAIRMKDPCRSYLESKGWFDVPKSSCIGCPFHDDHFWNRLKTESPAEFQDAIDFDESVRNNSKRLRDPVYVHRSGRPLKSIVFSSDVGQGDLFGNECEGMCGV